MTPRSLKARLVAGTLLWLLLGLALGGVALSHAFRSSVESAFRARLDSLLMAVVAALEAPPGAPPHMVRAVPDPRFDRVYSGWYWQVADAAAPGERPQLLRSRSLWDEVLPAVGARDADATHTDTPDAGVVTGPRDQRLRFVSLGLRFPGRDAPLRVTVTGPESEVTNEVARFDRLLLLSLGALGATLAVALLIQVAYGLRPLRALARDLDAVRAGRSRRLATGYPSEIEPLARTMNDVLDHDARMVERARAHVGNLAHGLKTPLSVLALEADAVDPVHGQRIAEQVDAMSRLVEHHLARAAAAGRTQALGARCALAPVVDALRTTLLRIHAARALTIETRVPTDVAVAGERQDVEEMLGNLADNACKWARARVEIAATRVADGIEIAVDDDGPGLDPTEQDVALRRGGRLDDATPGSGLGLAIVSELAALYGGTLRLEPGPLGGLRARLVLPSA